MIKKKLSYIIIIIFSIFFIISLLVLSINLKCRVILKNEGNDKVAYLKEGIFQKRDALKWIVFPEGTTAIGQDSFKNCSSLNKISFPNSLKEIRKGSFKFCSSINAVVIPKNVISIDDNAFEGCTNLQTVYLGEYLDNGLQYIGKKSFYNTSILSIEIPYTTKYIGDLAFGECRKLKELTIPETYYNDIKINNLVDSNIDELNVYMSTIEIEDINKLHGGIKYSIVNDEYACVEYGESDIIPNAIKYNNKIYNVEWIGEAAFNNCTIRKIRLPKYLYGIGDEAFKGSSKLKSIIFPDDLKVIRKEAFANCNSLEDVKLPSSLFKIGKKAFYGLNNLDVPNIDLIDEGGLAGIENVKIQKGIDINYIGNIFWDNGECKLKKLIVPGAWCESSQWDRLNIDQSIISIVTY